MLLHEGNFIIRRIIPSSIIEMPSPITSNCYDALADRVCRRVRKLLNSAGIREFSDPRTGSDVSVATLWQQVTFLDIFDVC